MNQANLTELQEQGYTVVRNALTNEQVATGYDLFMAWYNSCPAIERGRNYHGIIKHYNVGHTRFAWYTRCIPAVREAFARIWNEEDLAVSFDGSCYKKSTRKLVRNTHWMHTDSSPDPAKYRECYQGFVSYTTNQLSTLLLIPKSHLKHSQLHTVHQLPYKGDWCKVPKDICDTHFEPPVPVAVNAGDLVIWDSRVIHQNTYTWHETRLVQYVSYMPRKFIKPAMQEKRIKYFLDRRTTSHWVAPVRVVGLQPQTYGDPNAIIDYATVPSEDLANMLPEINRLV